MAAAGEEDTAAPVTAAEDEDTEIAESEAAVGMVVGMTVEATVLAAVEPLVAMTITMTAVVQVIAWEEGPMTATSQRASQTILQIALLLTRKKLLVDRERSRSTLRPTPQLRQLPRLLLHQLPSLHQPPHQLWISSVPRMISSDRRLQLPLQLPQHHSSTPSTPLVGSH